MLKIVCAAKFLERPTLNNPKGGPMSGPGSEYLSQMAQESLRKVDAQRRHEFLRRKEDKDVEEKAEIDNRILQIRRNFGWPFSIGLVSEGDMQENYEPSISSTLNPFSAPSLSLVLQENYELGWEGVPCCSYCGASHIQVACSQNSPACKAVRRPARAICWAPARSHSLCIPSRVLVCVSRGR